MILNNPLCSRIHGTGIFISIFAFRDVFNICFHIRLYSHMDVSKNNGTPKSSILIWFSIIFTIHFGGFPPPMFGSTPIWDWYHSDVCRLKQPYGSYKHTVRPRQTSVEIRDRVVELDVGVGLISETHKSRVVLSNMFYFHPYLGK